MEESGRFAEVHLVVDVGVSLPPCQVVPQNGVCWIAYGSPVKHGSPLQWSVDKAVCPEADVAACEAGGYKGDKLACPPACMHACTHKLMNFSQCPRLATRSCQGRQGLLTGARQARADLRAILGV